MSETRPFGERLGFKSSKQVIQTDSMDDSLRNSLWNILWDELFGNANFTSDEASPTETSFDQLAGRLWGTFFKLPKNTISSDWYETTHEIFKRYSNLSWFEVYEFVEFVLCYGGKFPEYVARINAILERETSGYRLVGDRFSPITSDTELQQIDEALKDTEFPGVASHIKRALELLSDKQQPDFRNSIKEAISAVESAACSLAKKPKAELRDALAALETKGTLHPALKEGFVKLYAYTSDENGIRHKMMDVPNLKVADAVFFLVSCSAFVNSLKANS
jgi:hypothetical protein